MEKFAFKNKRVIKVFDLAFKYLGSMKTQLSLKVANINYFLSPSRMIFSRFTCKYYIFTLFLVFSALKIVGQSKIKISEVGTPFLKVFSEKNHLTMRNTYTVEQSADGTLYFANGWGLSEYDGKKWSLILQDQKVDVGGLALGESNRIYTIEQQRRDFGFWFPNEKGALTFQSLTDKLPAGVTDLGTLSSVENAHGKIYFRSNNDVLVYDPLLDSLTSIHTEGRFGLGTVVNGDYFLMEYGKGLIRITEGKSELLPGSEAMTPLRLQQITPFSEGKLLLVSYDQGLFIYDFEKFTPWKNDVNEVLKQAKAWSAVSLYNEYFAIGSGAAGVLILDKEGNLIQRLDKQMGVPDFAVYDLFLDKDDNLWVAQSSAITQIILNSPFHQIDMRHGLNGEYAFSAASNNGKTYIATSRGLVYKEDKSPWQGLNDYQPFKAVEGVNGRINGFLKQGDDFFALTTFGFFQLINDRLQLISDLEMYWVGYEMTNSDQIILGSRQGHLHLVKKVNGRWRYQHQIKGFNNQIGYIAEAEDGKLWVTDAGSGVFKITLNSAQDSAINIRKYGEAEGLPEVQNNRLLSTAKGLSFRTSNGIYRYDLKQDRFVSQAEVDELLKDINVLRITEAGNGDIMYAAPDLKGLLRKTENGYIEDKALLSKVNTHSTQTVTSKGNNQWWLVGDGIIVVDAAKALVPNYKFNANVKSAVVTNKADSLIFGGFERATPIQLPYQQNAIRFNFAASFYDTSEQIEFQSILEGTKDDWSTWDTQTNRSFTNLPHGDYVFKVRARNINGQISEIDQLTFTMLRPWFLAWWAYFIYAIIIVAIVWFIVKLNASKLEREKLALAKTVEERTEKITEQADRLKAIDEKRSTFFANISHELKTPLTLINTPLERLIYEEKIDDEEVRKTIQMAVRNGESLLSLVEEILDLAKMDEGKLKLKENPIRLNELLEFMLTSYHSAFVQKAIVFNYNFELKKSLALLLDGDRITKIINNLLSNALKFTPNGGQIDLSVVEGTKPNTLIIKLMDNGMGIPPEDLPYVFDRYYQSEQPKRQVVGGTGIGLALAKELAILHGGSILVESRLNVGTIFSLELPIKEVKEETLVPLTGTESKRLKSSLDETITKYSEKFALERPVLLITEDHPEMRAFIAQTLQPYFEIHTAENGQRALDILNQTHIDIVISDVMMPVMDGFELLEAIKANEALRQISFIMLTASAGQDEKLHALTLGIDDYLTKPFNASEFLARIKNILENRIKIIRELKQFEQLNLDSKSVDLESFIKTYDFSERELEIMKLLAKRMTNPEIADALFISRNTVKYHIKNIFGKLGVRSRLKALEIVKPLIE
jgi:signal transduction histidine kinase/DNA-binding NarL/FixJ family response regulator